MESSEPVASRRRVGRPSRLSRELIISTTLDMLDEVGLEDFSVAKLSKRLGASPMSPYTYFVSREALLDAVADEAFLLFNMPERSDRWQDFILAWLQAITWHFERFPVALKVIAWDEHISTGWLRVWLPVLHVLAEQEANDERLALIVGWFSNASVGLIQAQLHRSGDGREILDNELEFLTPNDRKLLKTIYRHAPPQRPQMLELGFRNIIAGLEGLFASTI